MSLITRMRKQKAVYWAPKSKTVTGQWTYCDPVEIKCRWDDESQNFVGSDGTDKVSSATVYVDRDLALDGMLMLGELKSIKSSDPFKNPLAFKIAKVNKIPNLKAREFLRWVLV